MGLSISAPDHSTVSRRAETLPVTSRPCFCSATRLMAGQRQPDGRSLRTVMMAWLTYGEQAKMSLDALAVVRQIAAPWSDQNIAATLNRKTAPG